MVLELLFLIYFVFSRTCTPEDRILSFSECMNGSITALFYWKVNNCDNPVRPPIYNISCKIECPPGKYLSVNEENLTVCLDCPIGTYSSGNLLRFSDHDYNFDQANDFFESHCKWIDFSGVFHHDEGCTSWHSSQDNTYFQVGSQNNKSSIILYQALIHPNFIKEGYINFRYKTNFPKPLGERPNCWLIFGIDGEIVDNDT